MTSTSFIQLKSLSQRTRHFFLGSSASEVIIYFICASFAFFMLPLFAPMLGESLDSGWMMALNEAWIRHWRFGTDIIFTFGPLGFIYPSGYYPGTYATKLFLLAVIYFIALFCIARWLRLAKAAPWKAIPATLFLAISYNNSQDAFFFGASFLAVSLLACRPKQLSFDFLLAIILLAIISLIKGTYFMYAMGSLVLFIIVNDQKRYISIINLMLYITAVICAWIFTGQPLQNLPIYLQNFLEISSGYNYGMSVNGHFIETVIFVALAAIISLSIWRTPFTSAIIQRPLMVLIVAWLLFIAFKSGYVRHDGHSIMSWHTLAFLCLALLATQLANRWITLSTLVISIFGICFTLTHYLNVSKKDLANALLGRPILNMTHMWSASRNFREHVRQLDIQHAAHKPPHSALAPRPSGTTDIYGFGQAALINRGYHLQMRPIFQSYSAYTPKLAEINRTFLERYGAKHIYFGIELVDNRYPTLDDGPSLPLLFSHYQPTTEDNRDALDGKYTHLQRRDNALYVQHTPIFTGQVRLGDWIQLAPVKSELIFAKINIKPTLVGSFVSSLYKPKHLDIEVLTLDGQRIRHRFVAGSAAAGFIISPYITNTLAFNALYNANLNPNNNPKSVVGLKVTMEDNKIKGSWKQDMQIEITRLALK